MYLIWYLLQFVAHPHCQQLLASIWYDGLPGFRRQHIAYKMFMTFTIGILSPIWAMLYILAPKSTFGNLMRKPFIKFIVHSASYCAFLCEYLLYKTEFKLASSTIHQYLKSKIVHLLYTHHSIRITPKSHHGRS